MVSLNIAYRRLLSPLALAAAGTIRQFNERTGDVMYRHDGPTTLSVDLSKGVLVPRWRRLPPHIPFADTIWQMMATDDLSWLNQYAAFLRGPDCDNNRLPKAYGLRWGWQLPHLIDHLKHDLTSRQVFMSTWFAPEDVASGPRSPMPPCLVGLQFHVVEGGLDLTVFSRSCDIALGLPHDLLNMCFVAHLIANELHISARSAHFLFSDLHLYSAHTPAMTAMLEQDWLPPLSLPIPRSWTRHSVVEEGHRDDLVIRMREDLRPVLQQLPHVELGVP